MSQFMKIKKVLFIVALCLGLSTWNCFAQNMDSKYIVSEDQGFSYYQIIEQRNFFRPKKDPSKENIDTDKKPSQANTKEKKEDTMDLVLTGVIEIKNGYKAIIEKKGTEKGFYVAVGEAVEDYTVKEIQINKVTLEKDAKTFELKLKQAARKTSSVSMQKPKSNDKEAQAENNNQENQYINPSQKLRMGVRGKQ